MVQGERRILTIEESPVIQNILSALSAAADAEGTAPVGMGKRLEAFAQQGCDSLILNLRVAEEPSVDFVPQVKIIGASLVGAVLVVTCHATISWVREINEITQRHYFPWQVVSRLGAFVHALF